MILITGAAGKTGRALLKALVARGAAAHVFARNPEAAARLRDLGAMAATVGDLGDEEALAKAAAGATAIYHICPNVSDAEVAIAKTVVAAARRAGVLRLVYHSVLHPQLEAMPHHWDKLRVEEFLFSTGLDVTVLQPTAYMQNLLAGWPAIVAGAYRFPYPASTRISLIDLDDVAEAAARVLTEPGHEGATYELVGSPPHDQREVAAILSEALGRQVRAEPQSLGAWEAASTELPEAARARLAAMFRFYAAAGLVGNTNVLGWLLGRRPTGLLDFARRAAAGGAVNR